MNHLAMKVLERTCHIVLPPFVILLLAAAALDTGQGDVQPESPNEEGESTTDLDLIRQAQAGDDSAFTALYHWYYRRIYYYLLRLLGNTDDASDVAAETFAKAWQHISGVLDGRRFSSWLYSIATSTALDHLRRRKRDQAFWSSPDENLNDENTTGFERAIEEQELVRLALAKVAPKPRACLLLQIEGFSQEEIARQVGLQKKSVSTYVCMAREQFRRAYHQLGNR